MSPDPVLTIGELAARAAVTPDTLRYYERLGLISPTRRTPGGFRVYTADVVQRLRFIKQAQRHGLTLAEIRELLPQDGRRGRSQCRQVQQVLQRKLTDLEVEFVQLQEFRRSLKRYLAQCDRALGRSQDADCPVVVSLTKSGR